MVYSNFFHWLYITVNPPPARNNTKPTIWSFVSDSGRRERYKIFSKYITNFYSGQRCKIFSLKLFDWEVKICEFRFLNFKKVKKKAQSHCTVYTR